ncbi:MAG: Ig-like domain-containing protein [Lachnoclostridium sp.]|nr:Ig-like domain-containing protein [Lachnoclostridium sp.]
MDTTGKTLRWLLVAILAAVVAACASIGRPEGGPRDELPPVYVRSNPRPGQTEFKGDRITIDFDENVQLDDAMNKVVVSPAQRTTPQVSALGKRITVQLRDTMIPDVTYTIDFSDAIKDLNEGNILDGFAIDFATGPVIDTLRISGMVLEAKTLEPAQGMLVGVYSNLSDTAISTLPFERITKTNQLGQFTLRGLKEGTYRIFAIDDKNRDYHWDRSENIAFYDTLITPVARPVMVVDTLTSSDGRDSLVERQTTAFYPDDILLTWFNEDYKARYMMDNKRTERGRIDLMFSTPGDTLPILKLINTYRAGDDISTWAALKASETLDTLTYWITDTALVATDSILVEAKYMRTDTLDNLSMATDTLKFFMRPARPKKEKKSKKDEEADTIPPVIPTIKLDVTSGTMQQLNRPLTLRSQSAIESFDSTGVSLEMLEDSTWIPLTPPHFSRVSQYNPMEYLAPYEWLENTKYRLTIDSAMITDIYGLVNKPVKHEFTTRSLSDYSTVTFNIEGLDGRPAMVELLSTSDAPVATAPVENGSATLRYLNPGVYYARLYIDSDTSQTYTTGNLLTSLQPEETYYYPKKLNLKKNWDIEQSWNIYELPLDTQKPFEIKKNKPKRSNREETYSDEDDEEDDMYNNQFLNPAGNGSSFDNLNNRSGRNSPRFM